MTKKKSLNSMHDALRKAMERDVMSKVEELDKKAQEAWEKIDKANK